MRASSSEHFPALDGLRGVAILLVMLGHFDERGTLVFTRLGWTGVDLFFVLSGFLITGILLRTRGASNYYSAFFGRRALRIFPLYYVALVLVLGVFAQATGVQSAEHRWQFWLYLSNFGVVAFGWPPVALGHFWSLAVEEHFYLVWPATVRALGPRRLLSAGTSIVLAVILLRCALIAQHTPWPACHFLTPCRADSLVVGAMIAALHSTERGRSALDRWKLRSLALSAAMIAGTIAVGGTTMASPAVRSIGYTIFAVFYGSLLVSLLHSRALSAAPLQFLGKYSYGAYVIHMPLMVAFAGYLPGDGLAATLARIAALTLSTFALAFVSWHLFEKRFLALKPEYRASMRPGLVPTKG